MKHVLTLLDKVADVTGRTFNGVLSLWLGFLSSLATPGGHIAVLLTLILGSGFMHVLYNWDLAETIMNQAIGALIMFFKMKGADDATSQNK
jgi:uncharacterized membrane protein YfcA